MKAKTTINRRDWVHEAIWDSIEGAVDVCLKEPWCFRDDPGCGTRFFDTWSEAESATRKCRLYRQRREQ